MPVAPVVQTLHLRVNATAAGPAIAFEPQELDFGVGLVKTPQSKVGAFAASEDGGHAAVCYRGSARLHPAPRPFDASADCMASRMMRGVSIAQIMTDSAFKLLTRPLRTPCSLSQTLRLINSSDVDVAYELAYALLERPGNADAAAVTDPAASHDEGLRKEAHKVASAHGAKEHAPFDGSHGGGNSGSGSSGNKGALIPLQGARGGAAAAKALLLADTPSGTLASHSSITVTITFQVCWSLLLSMYR